jgi:hypothetical protein
MDEKILDLLNKASVEELAAIKDRCTELLKSKKDEIKAKNQAEKAKVQSEHVEQAKAKLAVGATITFTMKGAVRTAVVEKVSEKTATVKLPEGTRYIQFKFITNVEPAVEAEPAQEAVA